MNLFRVIHKAYRAAYKVNRMARTAEVVESGNPERVAKLIERRTAYGLFARIANRLFK